MNDISWDATQYLRFEDERLRPALDLMARIPHPGPARVVDLGCGAGNALAPLAARFPGAVVTGVDGSAAMLAKAAATGFATDQADIAAWAPAAPVDVLFSNAALQWLGGHEALFPRLLSHLTPGGVLAVQMPSMHAAPLRAEQDRIARDGPWAERLSRIGSAPPILAPGEYYDLLRPRVAALDIWVTEYVHVLRGADPVVQWAMGTSLRPFLDALDGSLREGFLDAYRAAMRAAYPPRADGAVLLPFRRLFLLARVR
ncbi:methyltransferase domain-containing protein [Roseomonas sp. PWR1]|uniref:Methyltransferase domain-containing protein n=1 Tax=Roseomonas nitratireducens TaxID=2820810 RepID=A0ABS4AQX7_9PROT|nr:methyltransferase domain-containing protein [Neoroseomonas nitratireducens]MBP0463672.1 methyltransferase domain-containing protein [Neoroseomonas nitratireducens]